MAKMIYANYEVASTWDLDEVCEEHEIDPDNVVSYYVKWDALHLTYKDADGNKHEIEVEPTGWPASDFDWKRPTSLVTEDDEETV